MPGKVTNKTATFCVPVVLQTLCAEAAKGLHKTIASAKPQTASPLGRNAVRKRLAKTVRLNTTKNASNDHFACVRQPLKRFKSPVCTADRPVASVERTLETATSDPSRTPSITTLEPGSRLDELAFGKCRLS